MEDSRCQKGQQKFIRAWNIEPVRHQVTISHRVSCLVFHACCECEAMHRGSKSVRTPSLYVQKELQRFSFELLNLYNHIRQTLFPIRKDKKVRFKTTHIWGANISLQWAGKCSLYRTLVEGTFIGHTMSIITDQFTKAKTSSNFYPKFTFSHSLVLTRLQKAWLLLCHQMVDYRWKCEAVVKLRFSNMPPSAKSMTSCLLGGGNGGVRRRINERSLGLLHLIHFSTFHFTLSIHFPAPKMIRIIHVLQRCL